LAGVIRWVVVLGGRWVVVIRWTSVAEGRELKRGAMSYAEGRELKRGAMSYADGAGTEAGGDVIRWTGRKS